MAAARGSVRRHVRIACPPDDVWAYVGAPARLHEWWPGVVSCTFDGRTRVAVLGSGIPMPEEVVTVDPLQRRFQYRIAAPIVSEHLSTIDVLDLEDGTSLVVYAADANPSTMALIVGGAAGNALENLRSILEASTS